MNIVYMHSHDTGRRISPYGPGGHTPSLERFAEGATLFTNAFSVAPTCSPSRAGLLTGRYPHEVGMLGLAHRGFRLNDYREHLVAPLNTLGYETVLCGVQHVAPQKSMIGYARVLDGTEDYFDSPPEDIAHYDRANAERAAAFIAERSQEKAPFFLSLGFLQTHRPFAREGDTPEEDYAAFRTTAESMDQSIGLVMDAIDRADAWDQTVVMYTTDHGIAFPDMKATLRADGVGVALLLWVPPALLDAKAPRRIDALVSHIDLNRTILEIAGAAGTEESGDWSARNILPLLNGTTDSIRDLVFTEMTFHAAYEPVRSVRSRSYSLIRRFGPRRRRVAANVDDSPSKNEAASQGFFTEATPEVELYDLRTDPDEQENLAEDPAMRTTREQLLGALRDWMIATNDPLLQGEVLPPREAILDSPDAWSPT